MPTLNTAKIIRRVRRRLEVSQEGLSRLLNATKGAVQHWERGRNNPDLARLFALRQLCPPGPERKDLDALIRQAQAEVAPLSPGAPSAALRGAVGPGGSRLVPPFPEQGVALLRKENARLHRQVEKLQVALQKRNEQLRILEDLATDLQREMAELRAGVSGKVSRPRGPAA
jgi:transcriptional regulator with XRE-family HTH domain